MFDVIAAGGMATVHFGRLLGPAGFSRTVVIKRLHAQYAGDPELSAMFLDEARVAARIRHANVVAVIDVVQEGPEILLVMEYVHGESLAYLLRADAARDAGRASAPPPSRNHARIKVIGNVMAGALQGLHAAHEATGEDNQPLGVVHRDFSPQNILVGVDGTSRVLDFGVAKAKGQMHHTGVGQVKGKIRYLAPEQVTCGEVDRRTDLWAASVVLWEALTGKRLFSGDHDAGVLDQVLHRSIPSPREIAPDVPEALARVVMRGLERDRTQRFATALEMAAALEDAVGLVPRRVIGAWAERVARGRLDERRRVLDEIEARGDALALSSTPAGGFAITTDVAMVRVPTPEAEPPTIADRPARRRAPTIAWGTALAVVMAIAGGVGTQLFGRAQVRTVITTAAPLPPATSVVEALAAPLPPATAAPAPAPPPTASAREPTSGPTVRHAPLRRRPGLSRTRGLSVDIAGPPLAAKE